MKKIYYGIQNRNLIDSRPPVDISEFNHPDAKNLREKLIVHVSIGKEVPDSDKGKKSVNWMNISFEIEKDQNGLFLGELDFSRNFIS